MGKPKYYIDSRHRNSNFGRISDVPRLDPIGRKRSVGPADYSPVDSMNKAGKFPDELLDRAAQIELEESKESEIEYADVTGEIELPTIKKKKRRNKKINS